MFLYLKPADRPVIDGLEAEEVVYAKDQPQYMPLRTLQSRDQERRVLSRWALTPSQRQAILDGSDIYLELMTFGSPLQPIRIAVATERAPSIAQVLSDWYGLARRSLMPHLVSRKRA